MGTSAARLTSGVAMSPAGKNPDQQDRYTLFVTSCNELGVINLLRAGGIRLVASLLVLSTLLQDDKLTCRLYQVKIVSLTCFKTS